MDGKINVGNRVWTFMRKKWQKWNLKDENDNLRGCNLEFCLM